LRIAYQVVGSGPFDLVYVPGFVSNVDLYWEMPKRASFFSRLAAFSRLILFDKRGTGLSDRNAGVANREERMDDVRAVMDAADSKRAALFGVSEGGLMNLLFAATYPQRVQAVRRVHRQRAGWQGAANLSHRSCSSGRQEIEKACRGARRAHLSQRDDQAFVRRQLENLMNWLAHVPLMS
jgi:hypothetical protein